MTRWVIVLAMLAALGSPEATRGETVAKLPPEFTEAVPEEWLSDLDKRSDDRYRDRVLARYADLLSENRHVEVLKALTQDYRGRVAAGGPDEPGIEVSRAFLAEMEELLKRFRVAVEGATAAGEDLADATTRSRILDALEDGDSAYGAESLLMEVEIAGEFGEMSTGYFLGRDANRSLTSRESGDGHELLVPRSVMRDLRLRGDAVQAFFKNFEEPVRAVQVASLEKIDRRWDNYLVHGYSQYPWEALVNGVLVDFRAFEPPDKQWILAHPALGFETSTVGFDEIRATEVLSVEVLGLIAYYGREGEHLLGAAFAATFREDLGPGLGAVLHWENSSLGIAWHDVDGDGGRRDDDPFVFLSYDLFRFFRTGEAAFGNERQQIRNLLPSGNEG